MDTYHLHQSLLATTTTTTTTAIAAPTTTYGVRALNSSVPKSVHPSIITSLSDVIFRIILISFIGIVSIWANHEASKGFSVTIVNDAGKYSLAGKRFSLFYESNDKATRILLNTSNFVESLLYPNQDSLHTKKQINGVTLRLAPIKFSSIVSVALLKHHEYLINLSPSLMETSNNNELIVLAVLQGMARVWLWDGKGATPPVLLNGIMEYITSLAGFTMTEVLNSGGAATMSPEKNEICWKDEDQRKVAGFLRYYDQRTPPGGGGGGGGGSGSGEMIRRLNDGMRNGWHDLMVDDALGMTGQHACVYYGMMMRDHYQSSSL